MVLDYNIEYCCCSSMPSHPHQHPPSLALIVCLPPFVCIYPTWYVGTGICLLLRHSRPLCICTDIWPFFCRCHRQELSLFPFVPTFDVCCPAVTDYWSIHSCLYRHLALFPPLTPVVGHIHAVLVPGTGTRVCNTRGCLSRMPRSSALANRRDVLEKNVARGFFLT